MRPLCKVLYHSKCHMTYSKESLELVEEAAEKVGGCIAFRTIALVVFHPVCCTLRISLPMHCYWPICAFSIHTFMI